MLLYPLEVLIDQLTVFGVTSVPFSSVIAALRSCVDPLTRSVSFSLMRPSLGFLISTEKPPFISTMLSLVVKLSKYWFLEAFDLIVALTGLETSVFHVMLHWPLLFVLHVLVVSKFPVTFVIRSTVAFSTLSPSRSVTV